jgi:hypothetical protein
MKSKKSNYSLFQLLQCVSLSLVLKLLIKFDKYQPLWWKGKAHGLRSDFLVDISW